MNNFAIAFYIGGLGIRWYSIMVLIGILATIVAGLVQAKVKGIPLKPLENFIFIGLISGYIGARIWYIIGNANNISNFYDVIAIWNGGISILGGVLFASISALIYFHRIKVKYDVSMWTYFDIIMSSVIIGQVIGRWGNFFNQEILGPVGSIKDFPFNCLPHFIINHLHYPKENNYGIYRQPLFLYESILNYLFFVYLYLLVNNKSFTDCINNLKLKKLFVFENGSRAIMWFAWYGLLRLILEPLRYSDDILQINRFPISIFMSCIFFSGGVFMFIVNEKYILLNFWEKNVKLL